MQQIDDIYAASQVPAPPTDDVGPLGFWQGSNAAVGQRATRIRYWWLNCVQQALVGLLVSGGIAQSKTDFTVVPQAVAIIGRRQVVFAQSGTWTVPAGVFRLKVRIWGAGGSGGGTSNIAYPGGGGGGGGYTEGYVAVAPGQVINYTVGQGAAAQAGGSSSFLTLSAMGGAAGGSGTNSAGGTGGVPGQGSGGSLNLGGAGGSLSLFFSSGNVEAGRGGPAPFGAGHSFASGGASVGFNANVGSFPGGGSSGCTNSTAPGGNGLIIVEY